MSYALAEVHMADLLKEPGLFRNFVRCRPPDDASFSASTYLLASGEIAHVFDRVITWSPQLNFADNSFQRDFQDAIVLIGDVAYAADKFCIPGWPAPQPGVLVHAAGVTTLLQRPLFALSERAGYLLALVTLVLTTAATYTVTRAGRRKKSEEKMAALREAISFVYALPCMIGAVVAAVLLAAIGYIWLDVYLIILLELLKLLLETAFVHFKVLRKTHR
jgi:hypothetical protein